MLTQNSLYTEEVTMVVEVCCNCGIVFGMPSNLNRVLRDDPDKWFYCPNGHSQHYSKSATQRKLEETKKLLEDAQNRLAQERTSKIQIENLLDKERKKLKRVQKGVCPCCTRSFTNLKKHMATKHPELNK